MTSVKSFHPPNEKDDGPECTVPKNVISRFRNELCYSCTGFLDSQPRNRLPSNNEVKIKLQEGTKWIQGIACYDGSLYVTCDDGNADLDEPDHMYRIDLSEDQSSASVVMEKEFTEVTRQGEIEGLSFDSGRHEFLLLYNRGARIIAGMPSGFYDGYDREIHEVYSYRLH